MNSHEEDNLQINCVAWFRMQYPKYIIHHSPNGGKRQIKVNKYGQRYCPEGTRFKKMGTIAGFPDLLIITPFKIIFIELKSKTGSRSPSQKEIHEELKSNGQKIFMAKSLEEFIDIVKKEL